MKINLLKDQIYDNIIFSEIESKIFSLPIFNRLHYILQNSMTYLVYPSNKTSRLTHSIGVCHVAGEMYNNSLKNSNEDVLVRFLTNKKEFIEGYSQNIKKLINDKYGIKADNYKDKFLKNEKIDFDKLYDYIDIVLGDSFIKHNSFAHKNLSDKKDLLFIELLLMQSVRIFALLHDYGHLPFSHLFEFAIEDFYEDVSDMEENKDKIEQLKKLIYEKDDIHEFIGKKFSIITLKYLNNNSYSEYSDDEKVAIDIIFELLRCILQEIHKEKDSNFYSLYQIVSSDLDADRIDYTMRDLYASGINSHANIDRIIKMFTLHEINDDDIKDKFVFYPSIQSLNDIDELYVDRENLYKMILNHHKVKKFDYVLQKIIKILLVNYLRSTDSKSDLIVVDNIGSLLETIYELYKDNEKDGHIERLFYKFSQMTDYWLLGILRNKLVQMIVEDSNDSDNFKKLSNELFGGTKTYKSLYKREYEFEKFINEIIKKIKNDGKLKSFFNNINDQEQHLLKYLKEIDWGKKIEKKLDILVAYIKLPKNPKNLKLIDVTTKTLFSYKPKIQEYKTAFYIYTNKFEQDRIIEETIKIIKDKQNV